MDVQRSAGGELEVEDEFACAGMLRRSLVSLHATVERIFGVKFCIGADDLSNGNNGQIWLKLQGWSSHVIAAKLFVKGVVNPEEQQEVSYPSALNCVFRGARGLFLDCLIKNTSAHIVVDSKGILLISGLAEPVVQALSLITDLVERCEDIPSRRTDNVDRGFGKCLDSRRNFDTLVEKWEDIHTQHLLVLPGSVKEILLDLVQESGFGASHNQAMTEGNSGLRMDLEGRWDSSTDQSVEGRKAGLGTDSETKHSFSQTFPLSKGTQRRAGGPEERLTYSPQEVGEEEQLEPGATLSMKVQNDSGQEEEQRLLSSVGNKEFWLLLKFFTTMGYTEDVVKRVLAQTGPKEASQILDLVQQEQDCSDMNQTIQIGQKLTNRDGGVALNQSERNLPCETLHREDEVGGKKAVIKNGTLQKVYDGERDGAAGVTRHFEGEGGAEVKENTQEEDFVLGVLKKAAASCGYMEQNVAKLYSMLPDRSTHQLLLELQREESKEKEAHMEGPREMDDVMVVKEFPKVEAKGKMYPFLPAEKRESNVKGWQEVSNLTRLKTPQQHSISQSTSLQKQPQPSKSKYPHHIILPEVKGPPVPTYPLPIAPPLTNLQSNTQYGQTNFWPDPSTQGNVVNPTPQSCMSLNCAPQGPETHVLSSTRSREKQGFMAASSVVVTGQQRFLEGLQAPFQLQLTDKPGDLKLREIIIDGSNVAMSHGLGHFFSCRGIALAVQHFWDRGHRRISALLPQWRQKNDPRIKERHYQNELHNLGLLSYTPSREVEGKRISSYDDRFMLQHAQKTDGVIVTNDNLRDLSDESSVWRDIIKKRLLQYTFVGDHFMVPDDPLGRGGPHLDDFLRSGHRTPDPGNHSFAGSATYFPPSKPLPCSQTEVLNFRERTLGGALDGTHRDGRAKSRGHRRKDWDEGQQQQQQQHRSPQETSNLRDQLCQVFVGQDNMVALVLQCHPEETNINALSDLILEQQKD